MKLHHHAPWLLALIPIALGIARLRFDVEVLNLLPADVPAVQGLKIYQQNFANARELIITLHAAEAEAAENAARSIADALRDQSEIIAEVTWQPPWLEHPDQAAELIAYLWLNQRPEIFGQLTNRLAVADLPALLAAARQELATSISPTDVARLSYDPFGLTQLPESATSSAPGFGEGQEMFASPDGAFRVIFVKAQGELTTYRDCARWLDIVKRAANEAL